MTVPTTSGSHGHVVSVMAGAIVIVVLAAGCAHSTSTTTKPPLPPRSTSTAGGTHASSSKRTRKPLLCIYPAAGNVGVVTPLPLSVNLNTWANACAQNGGHPVQRYGPLYLEPYNGVLYKPFRRGASGVFVRPHI